MRLLRKTEPEPGDDFGRWSRKLRASDRAAFAEVFQTLNEPLLRYAWRLTNDEAAAQDIVQDAFLKLWQVRETLDDDRSLKAYLYRIVRNLALNHIRASAQHATPVEDTDTWSSEHDAPIDEALDAEILDRSMKRWVEEMPERRREAFLLSRNHGLSHEEIAQVMNLTPRTVNTHIVLALKDLRMRIGQLEETTEPR